MFHSDSADSTSATPSRTGTPKLIAAEAGRNEKSNEKSNASSNRQGKSRSPPKTPIATFDGEIEPEDLIPEYVATKKRLLELSRTEKKGSQSKSATQQAKDSETDSTVAYLESKLKKIESDVLFDKFLAEQEWKKEKVVLEKQLATARKNPVVDPDSQVQSEDPASEVAEDDDVAAMAEKMAREILAENAEDDDIVGLFESLPQSEVDPTTGKLQTVINSSDGTKLYIREFSKWTGVAPKRVLEEACRSRYE
jgi:ATP-dependent RNA helicase DHX29